MVFLIFLSCASGSEKEKENSLEHKIQKSIDGVVEAFAYYPELPPADAYKECFISIIEEGNIKLHYAITDSFPWIYRKYSIVTIINADNQIYSIPFFPNKIANYWRFEFQEPDAKLPACHTTFEKEFLTAMDSLQLNDTQHTDSVVFNEIMLTVFNCKQLNANDSLTLRSNIFSIEDYCKELLDRSYDTILKGIYADKEHIYSGAFEDRNANRIYQIDYGKKEETDSQQKEKLKISIKVYGTHCIFDHPISLCRLE
jgi:hypothetical protein